MTCQRSIKADVTICMAPAALFRRFPGDAPHDRRIGAATRFFQFQIVEDEGRLGQGCVRCGWLPVAAGQREILEQTGLTADR